MATGAPSPDSVNKPESSWHASFLTFPVSSYLSATRTAHYESGATREPKTRRRPKPAANIPYMMPTAGYFPPVQTVAYSAASRERRVTTMVTLSRLSQERL